MRRPPDTSWDFSPVIELLDSDWANNVPSTPLSPQRVQSSANDRVRATNVVSLGSFNKIFEGLGFDPDTPLPILDPLERSVDDPFTSDDATTSPNNSADNADTGDDHQDDAKNATLDSLMDEHSSDREFSTVMTKKQRRRARKQAEKARKIEQSNFDRSQDNNKPQNTPALLDKAVEIQERGHAVLKQVAARSNVGAKIRPVTPVPSTPSKTGKASIPTATDRQSPELAFQPQHNPFSSINLHNEHSFESTYHSSSSFEAPNLNGGYTTVGTPYTLRALSNLNSTLSTQYTTVNSIPYHHQLPNGFHTSVQGWPSSIIPSHIPVVGIGNFPNLNTPSTIHQYRNKINITADIEQPRGHNTRGASKRSPKKHIVRSREDRDYDFLNCLIEKFPEDKKFLVSPMRLSNDGLSLTGVGGLHVFIDASNILIGFKEVTKRTGRSLRDMSFDCLALLLERRRPVAKRVYAGSTRKDAPIASVEKFNELAGAIGYEKNIYEQVFKAKEQTESQKFFKDVDRVGWAKATQRRSGSGSDSETGASPSSPTPALKWVEQGVDESLHLKMCQSIIDAETPSTMVLATGDGAVAEYSDGFLAHVERALRKGWNVELVSWKQQTSSGYKNRKFRQKWGDQFKIIELDDFLEYMVDA